MLTKQANDRQFPRVQIWRRGVAFGIDFIGVWILSSLLGSNAPGFGLVEAIVFIAGWFATRVLVPYNNFGQTLGRYALDIKLIAPRIGKVPDLQALCQREAVTGLGALLVAIALSYLASNIAVLILIAPLAIDCSFALADANGYRQAFHDRWAKTIAISTRRGYSLDIKVKRLLATIGNRVQK